MGRQRSKEEEGIKLIAAMGILLFGAWVFVPTFRPWLVGLAILAALVGLAVLTAGLRKASQTSERASVDHALSVFVEAMKPPAPPPPSVAPLSLDPIQSSRADVLAALRRIDWFHFEKVVAAIYRGYGDAVERFGGAQPDGGVDLIVTAKSGKFVVQCKHWCNGTVGVKNIRELLGTLTTSGIPKGVFVTMRGYSDEARDLGVKHGLVLLDQAQLAELIVGLGQTHGAEVLALLNDHRKFCPKCEREMVLRTAKRGVNAGKQFWGCSDYPRCVETLELE